jgi:hypothetical protein
MTRRLCIVPLFSAFALSAANALAQAPAIDHQEVGCVVAEKFALFRARFDPAESVARARVHFRAEGGPLWYYVEMKPQGDAFYGTLPKPRKTTKRIQYYIEVVDKAFAESRTPEYAPDVVEGAAACDMKKALAGAAKAASVVVGGPAGAPLIPAGFASSGIVAAGAAAGVAAGAAAGVSTAVIVAGVVGGGAAVAGVAVAAGGGGERSATTTTTTTLPPSLTGSWAGTAPDGLIITTRLECEVEHDLFLELTQAGASLGGTWRAVLRRPNPSPPPGSVCTNPVGNVIGPLAISGTVGAGSVSFALMIPPAPDPRPGDLTLSLTVNFTGNFTATRISGTWACAANCPQTGTWAVNRR